MEPMTLGSPAQSPKANPVNFAANSPFLPAYLMGEQQSSPSQRHGSLSPTKNRTGLFRSPGSETLDKSYNQHYLHQPLFESPTPGLSKQKVIEKSGPPVQSLFDTLEARYKYDPKENLTMNAKYNKNVTTFDTFQNNTLCNTEEKLTSTPKRSFNRPSMQNESMSSSPWSNRQPDPLSTDTWVTVLGFPPSTTNVILAHFAQCGTIVDKKFPSQGNWVHIKFSNSYEAKKALAFNGKVLAGSIMVGVLPYREAALGNKENLSITENSLANFNNSLVSPTRPVRPLAQPYLSPQQNNTNLTENMISPVPQKSTGLVTKAMEYVFGW